MTNEQKVLLRLMQTAVNGTDVDLSDIDNIDWQAVAKESHQQTVLVMALDAAAKIKDKIPSDVYSVWSKKAYSYLIANSKVEQAQKELVRILEDKKYPYIILKGEAVATYYPRSDLRALGDVDFLIDPSKKEEITALLHKNGYNSFFEEGHVCHVVFQKPDAHLELHYEIPGIPHGETGEKVRDFVESAVYEGEKKSDDSGSFNAPSDCHHALILLLHMQHHMVSEGIGLRHLCDWACFVKETVNKPFWKEKLIPFLKDIGLMTYTEAMTKVCSKAFGTECPDWALKADDILCEQILEDVLSGGNFGIKDESRVQSGMLITNRGKDGFNHNKWYRMYAVLKRNIEAQHPKVKKCPILYPFYFIQKILRYLILSIKGERLAINKLASEIDKRKSVYEQLQIFEVEEK